MTGRLEGDDGELFAALRGMWGDADPVPDHLANRMISAIAVDDVARELELLGLRSSEVRAMR